ncbi:hypothetical protein QBC35DRAFT_499621 [Podospora australis]|uniref:Uncharacterized protein n=1 Tax=Podospora australis TaxID=1536484 RepID=A0AAN6WVQ7_9PEZI|nr:hypothetical protein QBC35DRAFT_499621 [Podospora australis]
MTIFQRNRRRSYKFLFSVLLFGFCMARIVALTMRIVWANRPRDINVAIASQIFTAAGVLILFITNLVFAQRIIRAYHPFFGWSKGVTWLFRVLFASVVLVLIMVITVSIQSFFTLDERTRHIDRIVQLFCATYMAAFAFLPIPLLALAVIVPRRTKIDKFGKGHFRTKFALLAFTSTLLAAGAIFRAAVLYSSRPISDPAWYQSKPAYYCFNFVIELMVVFTYALSRFDKRFHIPDGSSAPGHYSCSDYGPDGSAVAAAVAAADFEKRSSYAYGKLYSTEGTKLGNSCKSLPTTATAIARSSTARRSMTRPNMALLSVGGSSTVGGSASASSSNISSSINTRPLTSSSARSIRSFPSRSLYTPASSTDLIQPGPPYEMDGATRAEDLAWMAKAMVGFQSDEFRVAPLRNIPSPLLSRPLPALPPVVPVRAYPPLLGPPELVGEDSRYGWPEESGTMGAIQEEGGGGEELFHDCRERRSSGGGEVSAQEESKDKKADDWMKLK